MFNFLTIIISFTFPLNLIYFTLLVVDYKESQMKMLRLYNPLCIKILEISNELCLENNQQINENKKIKIKRSYAKKINKVRFIAANTSNTNSNPSSTVEK